MEHFQDRLELFKKSVDVPRLQRTLRLLVMQFSLSTEASTNSDKTDMVSDLEALFQLLEDL